MVLVDLDSLYESSRALPRTAGFCCSNFRCALGCSQINADVIVSQCPADSLLKVRAGHGPNVARMGSKASSWEKPQPEYFGKFSRAEHVTQHCPSVIGRHASS